MVRCFSLAIIATLFGTFGCAPNAADNAAPAKALKSNDGELEAATLSANPKSKSTDMRSLGKFLCKGREYRVESAEIMAGISDPYWCDKYNKGKDKDLSWLISIETQTDDPAFPGPNVDIGLPIKISNWHNLAPYEKAWTEAVDAATGEGYGTMYIFDHQSIAPGRVQIKSRDGVQFQVVASGKNEEGIDFSLEVTAVFREIRVRGSEKDTDETILARLKSQLDDSNLSAAPFQLDHTYNSGVRMGEAIFSPKP